MPIPKGYKEKRLRSATSCASGSFRTLKKKAGKLYVHICCPKGKWNAKTKRCRVGTRAQSIVMKAKRLGSGGETHADKAEHAFMDAGHHARLASRSAYEGRCKDAYRELLTAKGALEEGKAHAESGGGHLLKLNDASKTVERTETRVLNSCIAPSRTNK